MKYDLYFMKMSVKENKTNNLQKKILLENTIFLNPKKIIL